MTKRIVLVGIGVAFAVTAAVASAQTPPVAPASPQVMQHVRLEATRLAGASWQKIEMVRGAAAAVAHPPTKTVWVTAVGAPAPPNLGEAGFKLGGLMVTGAAIPGVSGKASFEVQGISGRVVCQVLVQDVTTRATVATGNVIVSAPGPHDVATTAFTLQPGKEYQVWASVLVRLDTGAVPGVFAQVKVPTIKWEM